MRTRAAVFAALVLLCAATFRLSLRAQQPQPGSDAALAQEKHLRNVRQLTFGGQNAEAYFSSDGRRLIFQSKRGELKCDQMFTMNIDGSDVRMVSSGKGRTTCGYYFPEGKRILYSSTAPRGGPECPPPPDWSKGYRWAIYPTYDIIVADADGSHAHAITSAGYNAEATLSPDGKTIAFTSTRDGDLDIYTMKIDGTGVKRLTTELGYDGGPFWSRDGQWIVYRAYHPKTAQEVADYKTLLREHLIKPVNLEIWVMRADGTQKHQVTNNGAANFAPYFFPDGKRIMFASNLLAHDLNEMGNFELFAFNVDGSGLERITFNPTFDGFPMFSPDGKKLVFASNRNGKVPHETNVFIADWVP
jgi:TolB protein